MISPTPGTSTSIARTVLAVVVHAHVERFDRARIVVQDHRLAELLFGQIALVLGLQVDAPCDRVLERLAGLLQDLDRLGVLQPRESRCATICFEPARSTALSTCSAKNFMSSLAVGQHVAEDALQERSARAMLSSRS